MPWRRYLIKLTLNSKFFFYRQMSLQSYSRWARVLLSACSVITEAFFLRKMIVTDTKSPRAISTFLKSWNLLDTAKAVVNAWSSVPSSALSKSWIKLLGETVAPMNYEQEDR